MALPLHRRQFLRRLIGLPALIAASPLVDWEQILWVPKPQIVVPASRLKLHALSIDEINAITKANYLPKIEELFAASPFLVYLKDTGSSQRSYGPPIQQNFSFRT